MSGSRFTANSTRAPERPVTRTTPIYPHDLSYTVRLTTDATKLDALNAAVERFCPILNLLRQGVEVRGTVERVPANRAAA